MKNTTAIILSAFLVALLAYAYAKNARVADSQNATPPATPGAANPADPASPQPGGNNPISPQSGVTTPQNPTPGLTNQATTQALTNPATAQPGIMISTAPQPAGVNPGGKP
jgi:hypothetical protein